MSRWSLRPGYSNYGLVLQKCKPGLSWRARSRCEAALEVSTRYANSKGASGCCGVRVEGQFRSILGVSKSLVARKAKESKMQLAWASQKGTSSRSRLHLARRSKPKPFHRRALPTPLGKVERP